MLFRGTYYYNNVSVRLPMFAERVLLTSNLEITLNYFGLPNLHTVLCRSI